jgi:hypothetical protein
MEQRTIKKASKYGGVGPPRFLIIIPSNNGWIILRENI